MINKLKSWCRSQTGNTAIIVALAAVPLVGSAGVAVDMVRANQSQTVLQAAVDAAALAAGSDPMATDATVKKTIESYLKANGLQKSVSRVTKVDFNRDPKSTKITLDVRGELDTSLAHVLGIDKLDLEAKSEVESGTNTLEVALVLDNTLSMSAEKRLDTLKKAAKNLVGQLLKSTSSTTTVKIAIVPFSRYVNVGLSQKGEAWLDVPPDINDSWTQTQTCKYRLIDGTRDGVPIQVGEWYDCVETVPPIVHTYVMTWHGCVGSRSDLLDTQIGSNSDSYPGLLHRWCAAELQPLTDKQKVLDKKIDEMWPVDETYIAPGLLWGWNILTDDAPFEEAMSKADLKAANGHKIMVLMTDGDNTVSPSYPDHQGSDSLKADKKSAALCESIKADGIRLFTVAFKVEKKSAKDLLEECATAPNMAFDADNDAALLASFDEIAASLASLRLTK